MGKLRTAIEVITKEGPSPLLSKVYQNLHNQFNDYRGYKKTDIYGETLKFGTERSPTEDPMTKELLSDLKKSDVFYDVGAAIGRITCAAKAHSPETEIVAFEPYPPNVETLRSNLRLNRLSVDIQQVALSNENATTKFSTPQEETPGLGTGNLQKDTDESFIEVECRRLDDLIKSEALPIPSIVKIDVEGAESLVLEGGHNTFSDPNCRTIYLEVHLPSPQPRASIQDFGTEISDLRDQVNCLGFSVEELGRSSSGNRVFWKCVKH